LIPAPSLAALRRLEPPPQFLWLRFNDPLYWPAEFLLVFAHAEIILLCKRNEYLAPFWVQFSRTTSGGIMDKTGQTRNRLLEYIALKRSIVAKWRKQPPPNSK